MATLHEVKLKATVEILANIREVLLPLVDPSDSECGDMLGCTMNSITCVECLAKQIAKQYKRTLNTKTNDNEGYDL